MNTVRTASNDDNNGFGVWDMIIFILNEWKWFLPIGVCSTTFFKSLILGFLPSNWMWYSIISILFSLSWHYKWGTMFKDASKAGFIACFNKYPVQTTMVTSFVIGLSITILSYEVKFYDFAFWIGVITAIPFIYLISPLIKAVHKFLVWLGDWLIGKKEEKKEKKKA